MGNQMMCRAGRRAVEERLTRPQRLGRQPSDVDYKKLRKLILSQKLAPCFDAHEAEDPGCDLEECPICFLYYPSLNRSRCCAKGICTECFLQMKPSDATRLAQCPFCKTPCFAVEFRGARTEEEKGLEQAEEQKVIEAKIRMQRESENVEWVMPVDQTASEVQSSNPNLGGLSRGSVDARDIADTGTPLMGESFEADGSSVPNIYSTRNEEFAVDLEEIMLMEAIWQSLQDDRLQRQKIDQNYGSSNRVGTESGTHGSNNIGTLFVSSCRVYSSADSFAEHDTLQQRTSEPDYHRNWIDQDPCGDSSEESDGTVSKTDCCASSSNSDVHIISEATDLGCIDIPSTSNASVGSLLCLKEDPAPSCSHILGLITAEQPFTLATESKA